MDDDPLVGENRNYWNGFYQSRMVAFTTPSQFAVLVAQEFSGHDEILDLGAGDLRDSVFFANLGFKVCAVDMSDVAMRESRHPHVAAVAHTFGENSIAELEGRILEVLNPTKLLVYGRFFLHAISEHAEDEVLNFLKNVLTQFEGSVGCFEFRISEDVPLKKETPPHFRRFVNFDRFLEKVSDLGFLVTWTARGRGMAKWKDDDAYVGRAFLGLSS